MTARMRCVITTCDTNSNPFSSTKLHGFPKDQTKRRAWIDFCLFDKEPKPLIDRVCGRHFREEDYLDSGRILGRPRKDWLLKRVAVPSLFGPVEDGAVHNESLDNVPMDTADCPAEGDTITWGDVEEQEEEQEVFQENIPTGSCRLCFTVIDVTDKNAVNLFQETEFDGQMESLSNAVFRCFQLELEDSPQWPSFACGHCVSFLQQINQFKHKIVSTHEKFFNRLVTAKKKNQANRSVRSYDCDRLEQKILGLGLINCHLCGVKEECLRNLSVHMRDEHAVQTPYIHCCGKEHAIRRCAVDHIVYHLDKEVFKCSTCGKCFQTSLKLTAHMKQKHPDPESSLACPNCSKQFTTQGRLRQHMVIHLPKDQRPIKCTYCPDRFYNNSALLVHVQRMHDVKERFICEQCGKAFSNNGNYYDHKAIAHREKEECPICKARVKNLQVHLKRHNEGRAGKGVRIGEKEMENGDEVVKCPVCTEEMKRIMMRSHSLQHVTKGRQTMFCHICLTRISGGSRFREHMDEHKGVKHPCEYCPGKQVVYEKYQSWYFHMKSKHPTIYETIKGQNKRRTTTNVTFT